MTDATPIHFSGYRELSASDKLRMNTVKMLVNELLDYIELLSREPDKHDTRLLAIARMHLQQAYMAAVRSITKPEGV